MKLDRSFFARFLFFSLVVYLLAHLIPLYPLQVFVSGTASLILNVLGFDVVSYQGLIFTMLGIVEVTPECTGILSFSLFIGLILASRFSGDGLVFSSFIAAFVFPIWNGIRIALSIALGDGSMEVLHFSLWMISVFVIVGMYLFAIRAERSWFRKG